jgi:phage/plasmid-like protein (TIGR03299 family)
MIDTSNSRENIAYVGEVPWHGLGFALTPDQPLEVWLREAGLGYAVKASPVRYTDDADNARIFDERNVLYRSDTHAPLSVVSSDYKVVQPGTVIEFFRHLVGRSGFQMEVAGALDGGRRVWALARVNDGAPVIGHDVVRPYLLCATSYDGTMSTTAKFTAIRVVCHNTLTMSAGSGDRMRGQTERDKTDGPVVQCVRVPHSIDFDIAKTHLDLGIVLSAWDRFLAESRLLAATPVDEKFVIEFLKQLLPKRIAADGSEQPQEDGRTFKHLLAIWKGEEPSATLPEAQGTAWGLLNAVTYYADHERGGDKTRLNSAWFGTGDGLKTAANDLLLKIAA